ncbi:DUF11 domain-containing protein [Bizionia paragorgiae]|uniref:Conserved repeat domain-containing protein n=1 Tax=Bizionia paragorgiae TaxID=283786 RepID=A0A1H4DES0_BIZPA|nr:DUF11 domain-containing protein [Bizionia paragorgiae]SEA71231.1 conserved repeat domain-containing protein [Bizionia paragorgiae]
MHLSKKNALHYFFLFLSFSLFSQTSISGIVNSYAAVTDITVSNCEPCEADCGDVITVTSTSGFSAGDKALIIQMKGATLNTSNSSEGGTITSINQAGNYEFFQIAEVVGSTIRIQYPLIRSYDIDGVIQIVKIPQYNSVDIVGDLTAPAWNSATSTGGIVALSAEQIIFNANINVKGKGFKGLEMSVNGTPDNCSVNPNTQYVLPNTNNSSFDRGEGIAVPVAATNRGRAPRANGGGAGVSGDSGGGGGSNFGAGGIGGKRWCNADENGNTGIVAGGIGGFSMEPYLIQNKAFLGGGGGPGFITSSNFSLVPNGGGIVILFADTIEGNGYVIDADGISPTPIEPTGPADGGAGGGGGGTVLIKSDNINSNLTVNIRGGDGQDILDSDLHGPGGGGGGGVLLYSTPTLSPFVSLNNSGGAAGIHYTKNPKTAIIGSENGAEPGGPGGKRSLYNVIENTSYSADFDGDGVAAGCDLDSDNDGILDSEEGCGPDGIGDLNIISNLVEGNENNTDNGTYPTTISGLNATYTFEENGSDIKVVNLSAAGQQGPVFKFTGKKNETAAIDIVFSEYVLGSSFKLTDFDENEEVTVNVYDQNGTLISLAASPYVASRGSQVSQANNMFSTYSNPSDINGDLVSSDAVGSVSFNFRGLLISRINVAIKHVRENNSSIRFTQVNQFCIPLDSDLDGIPNYLDTDSDNDGCPDAMEAAGNITAVQLDTNGMITGGVDGDGVPTEVNGGQDTTAAVTINETVTINSITSDVSGAICSGTTITYTANATGTRVIDFSTNPYSTEALDPSEINNYQWYESTDGGTTFTILSGETTNTLTLTNVQVADPVKQFKVLASSANNSCGTEDTINLTVVNEADLSLVKTVHANQNATGSEITQANIGDTIYYKIVLTNSGPCDATASVKDVLPAGVSYIATSSTVPTGTFVVDDSSNIGTWDTVTVESGSAQTLIIAVLIGPNCGDITNFVEVETSTRPDPDSTPGNAQ